MPSFIFTKMNNHQDRRDFLKILIGGTGIAYLAMQGCGRDASSEVQRLSGPNYQTLLKRQRHSIAHSYIRDKSFDEKLLQKQSLKTDVVIIGGGASGLAASLKLQDEGYSYLLIENEEQLGGAGVKGSMNGISYPYGSVYFVEESDEIVSICKRAGIQYMTAPEDAVLFKNQLIQNFWSDVSIHSLDLPTTEKDGLKKFRDFLLDDSNMPSYPIPKKLSDKEAQLDAQTSRTFLKQYKSPFLETMMDIYSQSSMGAGIDATNAYCLLNFYSSEIGNEFGKRRFTFPGGMNELYNGMGKLLNPESVKTNHLAFSVKSTKDGAEVTCVDDEQSLLTIHAKKVIMTGQKHIAPFMIQDVPEDQRIAMMSMQYPPYATIHLSMKEELFPNTIMDVWTPESNGFCTDIICSNAMQRTIPEKHAYVYSIYGAMPLADRSLLLQDDSLAKHTMNIIEKTMGFLRRPMNLIQQAEVYAWGHALAIPYPGSHNGPAQLASRPFGNIHFGASDNDAASSVENALANGFSTAKEIITLLS
ncbi:MAG: FAD-binding protein [Bacteroidetes bacterium]|nr:FAD-binding protein [bacterium]NBP63848.1 FAD-binding protein [Bacteroidota bacterium]